MSNTLSTEKKTQVISALAECSSIRSVERSAWTVNDLVNAA
jgi:hypothetical protein